MTLEETVLQKLGEWRPPRDSRQTFNVTEPKSPWTVAITADRQDDLGCAVWELSVRRANGAAISGDAQVSDWAGRVPTQVTGLLEPVQVHEIDAQRNEALLRSKELSRRGKDAFYYEVHLKGVQEATVRRYRVAGESARREQVAFTLTHEMLAKFAADLVASAPQA
jgi:hypothetical protein